MIDKIAFPESLDTQYLKLRPYAGIDAQALLL